MIFTYCYRISVIVILKHTTELTNDGIKVCILKHITEWTPLIVTVCTLKHINELTLDIVVCLVKQITEWTPINYSVYFKTLEWMYYGYHYSVYF